VAEILRWRVKVVGITVMSPLVVDEVSQIISRLRSSGVHSHITLGGNFASLAPSELLKKMPEVDSIVLGEGEKTVVELVQLVQQNKEWTKLDGIAYREGEKIRINRPLNRIVELDTMPPPYRPLISELVASDIAPSILSSRGCYGNCCYCSVAAFHKLYPDGPSWRGRSPQHTVDEIEELYTKYGARRFCFTDDDFIGPYPEGWERAYRISEEILSRELPVKFALECRPNHVDFELFNKLKSAGLSLVLIGIESGCQRMLDFFRKKTTVHMNLQALKVLEKLKIPTHIDFIFLDPYTSLSEVKENLSFLNKFAQVMLFNLIGFLEPRAGTDFTQILFEQEELLGSFERYKYHFKDSRVEKLYRVIHESFKLLYYQTGRLTRLYWELEGIDGGSEKLKDYLSLPGTDHSMVEELISRKNMFTIRCAEKAIGFLSTPKEPGLEAVEEFGKSLEMEIEEFDKGFNYQLAMLQLWVSSLVSKDGKMSFDVWPSPGIIL